MQPSVKHAAEARMLHTILSEAKPRIQEREFVRDYLPMMIANTKEVGEVNIVNWLKIARNPACEVDVYNGNEYLYTVPPLMGHMGEVIAPPKNRYDSMFTKVVAWKLYEERAQALGDAFMKNSILPTLNQHQFNNRYVDMWNIIRSRYNLPLIPTGTRVLAGVTSEVNNVALVEDIPL